jgi:hypothetical protein
MSGIGIVLLIHHRHKPIGNINLFGSSFFLSCHRLQVFSLQFAFNTNNITEFR